MHQRIVTTVAHLRQDRARHLDEAAIHEICRQAGRLWRKCLLTPVATTHWLIIQVLHGNTAVDYVSLSAGRAFAGAAYRLARANLPLQVFQAVLRSVIKALVPETEAAAPWLGHHRTFQVDGSGFSMPDTPELQSSFGQPGNQKPGCGFPVASIVAMFHAGTGFLLEVVSAALRTSEMALLGPVHADLRPGDVLVADRGFCAFAHLALLACRDVHAVFRVHHRQIVDFTPHRPYVHPSKRVGGKGLSHSRSMRQLGVLDQLAERFKPLQKPPLDDPGSVQLAA